MRNFWTNHIEYLWEAHDVRGQTFGMFHLKTNNLPLDRKLTTDITPSAVSIQSMHFVFPFCPIERGYRVIPISKQAWETEANFLSDFSPFLPITVQSPSLTAELPSLWDFFKIKFTLRNLIAQPKSSLLDRGMAEFVFPNATFVTEYDETCFCCKLNLPHNSTLGKAERLERRMEFDTQLPSLIMAKDDGHTFLNTHDDKYTFLSCGDS